MPRSFISKNWKVNYKGMPRKNTPSLRIDSLLSRDPMLELAYYPAANLGLDEGFKHSEKEIFSVQAVHYLYLVSSGSQLCTRYFGVKCVLDFRCLKNISTRGQVVITQTDQFRVAQIWCGSSLPCNKSFADSVGALCSFARGEKKITGQVSKGDTPTLQIM